MLPVLDAELQEEYFIEQKKLLTDFKSVITSEIISLLLFAVQCTCDIQNECRIIARRGLNFCLENGLLSKSEELKWLFLLSDRFDQLNWQRYSGEDHIAVYVEALGFLTQYPTVELIEEAFRLAANLLPRLKATEAQLNRIYLTYLQFLYIKQPYLNIELFPYCSILSLFPLREGKMQFVIPVESDEKFYWIHFALILLI